MVDFCTRSLVCASERYSHGEEGAGVFEDREGTSVLIQLSRILEFWFAFQKYHLGLEAFLISGRRKSVLILSHLCWLWERNHWGLCMQAGRDVLWLDDPGEVRREVIQLSSWRNFGMLLGPRDKS